MNKIRRETRTKLLDGTEEVRLDYPSTARAKSLAMVDKGCISIDFYTPRYVLDVVERYAREIRFQGIELDPATAPHNPVGARRIFTPADDGLAQDWNTEGRPAGTFVFVNPPYGTALRIWVEKIAAEARRNTIVALLPGQRFEQRYWQRCLFDDSLLQGVVAVAGRINFEGPGRQKQTGRGGNPYGSFLYLLGRGHDRSVARRIFRELGLVIGISWTEQFEPSLPLLSRKGIARASTT